MSSSSIPLAIAYLALVLVAISSCTYADPAEVDLNKNNSLPTTSLPTTSAPISTSTPKNPEFNKEVKNSDGPTGVAGETNDNDIENFNNTSTVSSIVEVGFTANQALQSGNAASLFVNTKLIVGLVVAMIAANFLHSQRNSGLNV